MFLDMQNQEEKIWLVPRTTDVLKLISSATCLKEPFYVYDYDSMQICV
jgi:hypothetical protein